MRRGVYNQTVWKRRLIGSFCLHLVIYYPYPIFYNLTRSLWPVYVIDVLVRCVTAYYWLLPSQGAVQRVDKRAFFTCYGSRLSIIFSTRAPVSRLIDCLPLAIGRCWTVTAEYVSICRHNALLFRAGTLAGSSARRKFRKVTVPAHVFLENETSAAFFKNP